MAIIMKDFTAKEQIFLLDIMIGNLWLFLDRTSLCFESPYYFFRYNFRVKNVFSYINPPFPCHFQNVLIQRDVQGRLKAIIGDFGLASKIPTRANKLDNIRLPQVGSPYWMSPECLRGKY